MPCLFALICSGSVTITLLHLISRHTTSTVVCRMTATVQEHHLVESSVRSPSTSPRPSHSSFAGTRCTHSRDSGRRGLETVDDHLDKQATHSSLRSSTLRSPHSPPRMKTSTHLAKPREDASITCNPASSRKTAFTRESASIETKPLQEKVSINVGAAQTLGSHVADRHTSPCGLKALVLIVPSESSSSASCYDASVPVHIDIHTSTEFQSASPPSERESNGRKSVASLCRPHLLVSIVRYS